ncbi:hypothetical protein OE909_12235 [Treponema denticola]|uniref:hypothetical protein n=1 Tax=Treponema denticola TaxID=158 RepID=UPI0021F8EF9C|nr:hypothetical protein [Treponema denticola]UYT07721.1 hypothetical protein OE909_12235 [Treponema denticola]
MKTKLSDEIENIITSKKYKDDEIIKSYALALKQYKELIMKGIAEPKERNLPDIQEKMILRQKAEFNYINSSL